MKEVSTAGSAGAPMAGSGTNQENSTAVRVGLLLMAKRALLASLGAVAITIEEVNELVERLIERGEIAESDVTRFVNDYVSRSSAQEERARVKRLARVDVTALTLADSVEVILERLNVPTHADIEELSRKIALLNEKVALLKKHGGQLPAGRAEMTLSDGEGVFSAVEGEGAES